MRQSGDDTKANVHEMDMIPMLHGDNPNVSSRIHSTDQTKVEI